MRRPISAAESFPGSRFAVGARVTAYPLIPCRKCAACREGSFAQCVDYDYLGSRRDGAFAELVWAPEANLFPVPDGVDLLDPDGMIEGTGKRIRHVKVRSVEAAAAPALRAIVDAQVALKR